MRTAVREALPLDAEGTRRANEESLRAALTAPAPPRKRYGHEVT
jgi:hypothetical protein